MEVGVILGDQWTSVPPREHMRGLLSPGRGGAAQRLHAPHARPALRLPRRPLAAADPDARPHLGRARRRRAHRDDDRDRPALPPDPAGRGPRHARHRQRRPARRRRRARLPAGGVRVPRARHQGARRAVRGGARGDGATLDGGHRSRTTAGSGSSTTRPCTSSRSSSRTCRSGSARSRTPASDVPPGSGRPGRSRPPARSTRSRRWIDLFQRTRDEAGLPRVRIVPAPSRGRRSGATAPTRSRPTSATRAAGTSPTPQRGRTWAGTPEELTRTFTDTRRRPPRRGHRRGGRRAS